MADLNFFSPIGSSAPQTTSIAGNDEERALAAKTDAGGEHNTGLSSNTDTELRKRLGMRAAGAVGQQIAATDQAGGSVGYGTAVGSAISGAASGAMIGGAIGAGIGGAIGLGTGLLAKYESNKAKSALTKATRAREVALMRQQQEWLAKNKDRLALQGKVDMASLNAEFAKYQEDEKQASMTRGMTRMDSMADAIKKHSQDANKQLSEIF